MQRMNRPFGTAAAAIFGFMALAHLVRAILGWEISIDGVSIPLWCSWVAVVVMAGLSAMVWRETHA